MKILKKCAHLAAEDSMDLLEREEEKDVLHVNTKIAANSIGI